MYIIVLITGHEVLVNNSEEIAMPDQAARFVF